MPNTRRQKPIDPLSAAGALQNMVPDNSFRAVAASDTVPIKGGSARALYIGGAGDVAAINENGVAVVFKAVPAGVVLPILTARVNATGTTATDIVAL